jgi:formate hydrogenlyase subunit 6/NADH:ubiquinone oxidoreductase subunit I
MLNFLSLDSRLVLKWFLIDVSIREEPSAGNKTFRISHCFNVNQCVNIEICAFVGDLLQISNYKFEERERKIQQLNLLW